MIDARGVAVNESTLAAGRLLGRRCEVFHASIADGAASAGGANSGQ